MGKELKPILDQVVIATKFGIRLDTSTNKVSYPIMDNSSPQRIRESVEGSLQRLQTDYIDLYFQHRIDPTIPPGGMADLIQEGKIKHWGVSQADENYIRKANAVCPIIAIENRYSMMARDYESLFPILEELVIGFIAFSPMANGLLTGKYGKDIKFESADDYRNSMPQFKKDSFEKNRQFLQMIEELGQAKQTTPGQISMAWMLCKKKLGLYQFQVREN